MTKIELYEICDCFKTQDFRTKENFASKTEYNDLILMRIIKAYAKRFGLQRAIKKTLCEENLNLSQIKLRLNYIKNKMQNVHQSGENIDFFADYRNLKTSLIESYGTAKTFQPCYLGRNCSMSKSKVQNDLSNFGDEKRTPEGYVDGDCAQRPHPQWNILLQKDGKTVFSAKCSNEKVLPLLTLIYG